MCPSSDGTGASCPGHTANRVELERGGTSPAAAPVRSGTAFDALRTSLTSVRTPVGDAWILPRDEPSFRGARRRQRPQGSSRTARPTSSSTVPIGPCWSPTPLVVVSSGPRPSGETPPRRRRDRRTWRRARESVTIQPWRRPRPRHAMPFKRRPSPCPPYDRRSSAERWRRPAATDRPPRGSGRSGS
jgi:hypothetical protein